MDNKDRSLSIAKGIGILLVLYGHVIQRHMVVSGEDFFLNPVFKFIYTFHMPLFFFLSGYLMAGSLSRKGAGEVFVSRVKSLLIPFLCWSFLGICTTIGLEVIDHHPVDGSAILMVFLGQLLIDPAVWFLWVLFIIAVLALVSVKLAEKLGLAAYVVVGTIVLIYPLHQNGSAYFIQWFYFFFLAGFAVYRGQCHIPRGSLVLFFCLLLLLFIALFPLWGKTDYIYVHKMASSNSVRLLYDYLMGFLGIALVICIAKAAVVFKAFGFLETIGLYSLDIYLIQRYLLEGLYTRVIARWQTGFDHHPVWFLGVFAPLLAMVLTGVCMLVSRVLLRRNKTISTLLLGARQ